MCLPAESCGYIGEACCKKGGGSCEAAATCGEDQVCHPKITCGGVG